MENLVELILAKGFKITDTFFPSNSFDGSPMFTIEKDSNSHVISTSLELNNLS